MPQHHPIIPIAGRTPEVAETAWVAPTAAVIGAVTIGAGTGVFYSAVVRGDKSTITIGAGSNLQDGVVVHADPGFAAPSGPGSASATARCCTAAPSRTTA